ncbi:hypothetical protein [Oryza sativa Japonica Group]|uniref:Uncharacterized protein n=2 Tax=Oryza sativa subsp. japonica TaxID=39947 RepID=Q5ZEG3_ORYSJ|nr:hypothetical protein [Oryza sativa Japonica Group]BAD52789.1 hypothetical protein [Oryza sativa Japonica Group]
MARAAELRAAPHGWLAQRLASVVAAHGGGIKLRAAWFPSSELRHSDVQPAAARPGTVGPHHQVGLAGGNWYERIGPPGPPTKTNGNRRATNNSDPIWIVQVRSKIRVEVGHPVRHTGCKQQDEEEETGNREKHRCKSIYTTEKNAAKPSKRRRKDGDPYSPMHPINPAK